MACVNLEGGDEDILRHIQENLPELDVDVEILQEDEAEAASVHSETLRSISSTDDVGWRSPLSGELLSSKSSMSEYSQLSQAQNFLRFKRQESLNAIKSLKLRHVEAQVLLEAEKQSIEWDYFQRRAEQQSLVRESESGNMMQLTVLQQAMLDSLKDTKRQILKFWGSSRGSFDFDVVSKGYEFLDLPEVFCSEKRKTIWKRRYQIALLVSDMKELKNGIKVMDEILKKVSTYERDDTISSLHTSPESGLHRQPRPRPNSSNTSPLSLVQSEDDGQNSMQHVMDVDNFSEEGFEEQISTPECVSSETAGPRAMVEVETANDDQHDYDNPEAALPAQSASDISMEFIEDVASCYVLGGLVTNIGFKCVMFLHVFSPDIKDPFITKISKQILKNDFYCPAQKFLGKKYPFKKDERDDTKIDGMTFIVECKKKFTTFPEVLNHFREDHPLAKTERLRMCNRCHYLFIGDGNLYCHLMSAHYSGPEFGYMDGEHFKEKVKRYQRMRDYIGNGGGDFTEKEHHRHGHLRYHDLLDIWSTCFLCTHPRQFFEEPRDLIKHTHDVHHNLMI